MAKMNVSRVVWAIAVAGVIFFLDQLTKHLVLREDVFNALACLDRTQPCLLYTSDAADD